VNGGQLRVNVLGTMEVRLDGRELPLAGQRQRALLAALAIDHGRVVSVDRLVDVLWDSNPPATARVKVQGHVSAVRRMISQRTADGPLRTRSPGYLLSTEDVELDAAEFTRLVGQGEAAARSSQPAQAAELLGAALGLWRGPAFADVRSMAVRAAAAAIEERRLLAVEAKADADLAVGRCEVVAAELPECLATHPLRERLRGLLMRALCGVGCRAEALAVYRAGRQLMVSQLGIEPGPQLRGLHQRILAEDGAGDRRAARIALKGH
jgi:DNA-binding SARP family transcriptional activator